MANKAKHKSQEENQEDGKLAQNEAYENLHHILETEDGEKMF